MSSATEEGQREFLLSHQLGDYFEVLAQFPNSRRLRRSLVYRSLQKPIEKLMSGIEYGTYISGKPAQPKQDYFKAVAWNVERGICFDGILSLLKTHPDLVNADIYFLTETDVGMARSQNRNVARELAMALGLNYVFAPCYLNLCKGNPAEGHYAGENTLALHGNALLSRYPLTNLRSVALKNCRDKMKGGEKRIGCQKAVLADVKLPGHDLTVAVAHLDAFSSHRQRAGQMATILKSVAGASNPVLLGGDLNTSGYDSRHAAFAVLGFLNKLMRGMKDIIANHAAYPFRHFDRFLFRVLEKAGFDYQSLNQAGVGTFVYSIEDMKVNAIVTDVLPDWCRNGLVRIFKKFGGQVSIKLDWFAGRKISVANPSTGARTPKVIEGLLYKDLPVSDHAAITLDFVMNDS